MTARILALTLIAMMLVSSSNVRAAEFDAMDLHYFQPAPGLVTIGETNPLLSEQ